MIDQGVGVAEANNADMLMGLSLQDILGLAAPNLLSGITITNNAGDPTNDIDFSTGIARDSTNTVTMLASTAMTKQLDAAWAAGTNAGGRMSAAAIANTTYYCFAIMADADGSVDFGFDVSPIAPTMPTGYTYFRRVGTILRAGGTIRPFKQDGQYFSLNTPVIDVSAANPGTAAVLRTLSVPVGQRVQATIGVMFGATALADNPAGIIITDPSCADVAPGLGMATLIAYDATNKINNGGTMARVWTNTSGQVRSRLQLSAAGTTLYITTFGWLDPLS